jgi:MFS family permease
MNNLSQPGNRRLTAQEEKWPSPAYAWFVVVVLNFAYAFSVIDRTLMDLLIVPIEKSLSFGDSQAGWLLGPAFGLFYTLFGIPLGRVSDRYSRRWIITIGASLWCVMTILSGAAANFWQLFFARMGVGVGEASLNPAALSLISDYFPPERRALAASAYVNGSSVGSAMAFLVGGALVTFVGVHGIDRLPVLGAVAPWQAVFVLVGACGLGVSLMMLIVKEPARRIEILKDEKALALERPSWRELGRFLKLRQTLFLYHFGGFGAFSLLAYALLKWTPTFFSRRFGLPIGEIGHSLGFLFLIFGTSGSMAGGLAAGWLRRRNRPDATLRIVIYGVIGVVPPAILAAFMPTANLSLLFFGVTIFFIAFPSGVSVAAVQEVTPNRLRAQVTAIYYLAINIPGYMGPLVTALLTQYVFKDPSKVGWSISLASLIFGSLAALLVSRALKPFNAAIKL